MQKFGPNSQVHFDQRLCDFIILSFLEKVETLQLRFMRTLNTHTHTHTTHSSRKTVGSLCSKAFSLVHNPHWNMLLVNFIYLVLWLKYQELLVKHQPYAILLFDVKFRHCYVVSTAGSFLLFRPYQVILSCISHMCTTIDYHFSYLLYSSGKNETWNMDASVLYWKPLQIFFGRLFEIFVLSLS